MSSFAIAEKNIAATVGECAGADIGKGDALHALLVALVVAYKATRGIDDTRSALEFQIDNLADDIDYEFMRP